MWKLIQEFGSLKMSVAGLDTLVYKVGFAGLRGSNTAERFSQDKAVSGAADAARVLVTLGQAVEPLDNVANYVLKTTAAPSVQKVAATVTKSRLAELVGRVTHKCSEETQAFLKNSYKFLKGFGLGANIIYAGAKAVESKDKVDGAIVAFTSLAGMYAAENAYEKAVEKAAKLKLFDKVKIKGKYAVLNPIIKGAGFIAASCIGMNECEKVGEFITKH